MKRTLATVIKLLAAALLLGLHGISAAQTSCTVSVTPLNFGVFTGAQVQATGTVDLTCSGSQGSRANYSVSASAGNSGSYTQRYLLRSQLPTDRLNYTLTIALSTGSAAWGDGSAGTSVWTGRTAPINAGNAQRAASTTFTGTIAAGAVPSAGTYNDTITVTATWN